MKWNSWNEGIVVTQYQEGLWNKVINKFDDLEMYSFIGKCAVLKLDRTQDKSNVQTVSRTLGLKSLIWSS